MLISRSRTGWSDRFGRKPVILVSLVGIVIFVISFGLSRSFLWALATRALAGTLAGNGMLINNAVADISDDTNQARAYAIIGLSLNDASVTGPFIGFVLLFMHAPRAGSLTISLLRGTFANPQDTFPGSLGAIPLFRTFPYLLPCLITGAFVFGSLVLCIFYFKEVRCCFLCLRGPSYCLFSFRQLLRSSSGGGMHRQRLTCPLTTLRNPAPGRLRSSQHSSPSCATSSCLTSSIRPGTLSLSSSHIRPWRTEDFLVP